MMFLKNKFILLIQALRYLFGMLNSMLFVVGKLLISSLYNTCYITFSFVAFIITCVLYKITALSYTAISLSIIFFKRLLLLLVYFIIFTIKIPFYFLGGIFSWLQGFYHFLFIIFGKIKWFIYETILDFLGLFYISYKKVFPKELKLSILIILLYKLIVLPLILFIYIFHKVGFYVLKIINKLFYKITNTFFIKILFDFISKIIRILLIVITKFFIIIFNFMINVIYAPYSFLKNIIIFAILLLKIFYSIFISLFTIYFWKNLYKKTSFILYNVVKTSVFIVYFFCKEILEIILVIPQLVKSFVSFIYYDMLMLKKLMFWGLNNLFKATALIIALSILGLGSTLFYKDTNKFKELSKTWEGSLGFTNTTALVTKLLDSHIFQPIIFYNSNFSVESGSNLFDSLIIEGVGGTSANNLITTINKDFPVRKVSPNWSINITLASSKDWVENKVQRISLPVNRNYDLVIEADSNYNYTSYKQPRKLTRYILRRKILIKDSIYQSTINAGVPNSITVEVLNVLSWDVDFQREIRQNDRFEVIYECLFDQGDILVTCDNILYASLKGVNKSTSFYKYRGIYYHEDGKTVAKTLIKTPINNARLSSSFGVRSHPVLGYTLLHKGTDFAAPIGTPVYASGTGIIEIIKYSPTYGNYVVIKHNPHLSTLYAHMKGFAKGLIVGTHLKQGQVIGYLGGTGRVTGPHLHYEVIVNHKQVNPLTIQMPSDRKLEDDELRDFETQRVAFDNIIIKMPSRGKTISPIFEDNENSGIKNIATKKMIVGNIILTSHKK